MSLTHGIASFDRNATSHIPSVAVECREVGKISADMKRRAVPSATADSKLLPTALAWEVKQSPPSVRPSVCILFLVNRLTADLELLHVISQPS